MLTTFTRYLSSPLVLVTTAVLSILVLDGFGLTQRWFSFVVLVLLLALIAIKYVPHLPKEEEAPVKPEESSTTEYEIIPEQVTDADEGFTE